MNKLFLLAIACVFTALCMGQQKVLSMQDAMLNARTRLAPENLKQLHFIAGTDDYVYLAKEGDRDIWRKGNFKSKQEQPYLSLQDLNIRMRSANLDTFTAMPAIKFTQEGLQLTVKGNKYNLNNNNTFSLTDDKSISGLAAYERSSAGYSAYLKEHNLYVSNNGIEKQVTTDGSADIVYASSVHRDEFGITKGTFWSHRGNWLAFYRMDQSMVTDYPIINWVPVPAQNENIKYPMAGDKSHHVTVGVYNYDNNKTIYLKTGEPAEQYLTNIAWSPDDKYIFIAVLNRDQNHMWLKQFDATTGDFVKVIMEETDDKYTEPLHPMLFLPNDPTHFLWQSRRDGWNHLYEYRLDGTMLRQLTSGPWEVIDVKQFDAKAKNLYFTSTEVSPININLYRVNMKTGVRQRITGNEGMNTVMISDDGDYVLASSSTISNPRTIQLIETKSAQSKLLLQASNPLKDYLLGTLRLFTIPSQSGEDLVCRMFTPAGFDSTKQYPLIVYWYGGPHAQIINNSWNGGAGDYWFQYMAERGYIVFSLDTRGSANRGKAFEQTIFRRAGQMQMQDLETALQFLDTKPYISKTNRGLFGWSYGGFMTTDFVLNHPGAFKAAVAGGPVMNWRMYEVMYGERYMDTPQQNPDGYEATNLVKQAGKLKDKLLLIHGLQDPVVVQQHSVDFVKACVDAGVQVNYMIYPGHEHNVLGKDRAHLYQKVTDYFELYLK